MKQLALVIVSLLTISACTTLATATLATTTPANTRPQTKTSKPPKIEELTIESEGQRMSGLIYIASGAGPHPTVILLHGYPGNEKNLDLAQSLRREGWNVLFFHYRGAWGSEGEFSLTGAEADVQTVIAYLQQPENAERLRVDSNRISTTGHSMGGHMAVASMLDNPAITCAVALDGANLGANQGKGLFNDPQMGKVWRDYSDTLFMLNGWSGSKAVAEMESDGRELDLLPRARKVAGRPVLLLSADTDVVPAKTHTEPLYRALKSTPASKITYLTIQDDHSFSASRLVMIDAVIQFLNNKCR